MKRTAKQEEPVSEEKASDYLRVRMTGALKEQLRVALKDHKHIRGNLSEFVNDCAKALVLQHRRGEKPVYPFEFVAED